MTAPPDKIDVGKKEQTREYGGQTIHIIYRPQTNDFKWYYQRVFAVKVEGLANSIDACVNDARRFIDADIASKKS